MSYHVVSYRTYRIVRIVSYRIVLYHIVSCVGDNDHIYALLKEVPLLAILTRNISSDFIPEFCQYVSTILEKRPHVSDL